MKKIIALLCAVLMVTGLLMGCENSQGQAEDRPAYIEFQQVGENLGVIYNDTCFRTNYAYSRNLLITYSLDGASAACLTTEGALLYVHDGTVEKIADRATTYRLSASGDGIAYLVLKGHVASTVTDLYLYQKSTGQSEHVVTGGQGFVRSYACSPDGKTLAYSTTPNQWTGEGIQVCLYRDGESTACPLPDEKNYQVISINNGGDLLYLYGGGKVYSMDGEGTMTKVGETTTQRTSSSSKQFFYSNADHTQLLFAAHEGTYLSTNGQRGVHLSQGQMHPVKRASSYFCCNGGPDEDVYLGTCNFEDLSGQVMRNLNPYKNDRIRFWYPNENGEYVQRAEYGSYNGEEDYWLDATGSYLYYRDGQGKLWLLDLKNGGEAIMLAEGTMYFAVSADCSTVYYSSDTVYRCSGKEFTEPERFGVDVEGSVSRVYITQEGQVYFVCIYPQDVELFTLSKDGEVLLAVQHLRRVVYHPTGNIFLSTGEGETTRKDETCYVLLNGKLTELQMQDME